MEPLFIDTNIEYDLDTTLFPGITDPVMSSQPALLIASSERWTTPILNDDGVCDQCLNERNCDENLDTDDLYNFIDSFDLTNTDISKTFIGSGELEAVLSDILESASFSDEFNDIEQTFSNFESATFGKVESNITDNQCTLPSSKTITDNQCTLPSSTNITDNQCTLPSSTNITDNQCTLPSSTNITDNQCTLPSSTNIKPKNCFLSSCDLNGKLYFDLEKIETVFPLNCSCNEDFLDTSFIDLLDLQDQNYSRKRKHDNCYNDGAAFKKVHYENEKEFLKHSELPVLNWVTENEPHSSFGSSDIFFSRGS